MDTATLVLAETSDVHEMNQSTQVWTSINYCYVDLTYTDDDIMVKM